MTRTLTLRRDEAELMADLLMLTDHPNAYNLGVAVRELFGMADEARHLANMHKTRAGFQREWANELLARIRRPLIDDAEARRRNAFDTLPDDYECPH